MADLNKNPKGRRCVYSKHSVIRYETLTTGFLLTLARSLFQVEVFITHLHKHTHTSCTKPRGFGWRIHSGVEVTESSLSTNNQHTLIGEEGTLEEEVLCGECGSRSNGGGGGCGGGTRALMYYILHYLL